MSHALAGVGWGAAALAAGGALLLGCGGFPAAGYGSVSGTVAAGPTCPVEQAGEHCPNRPLRTTVRVITPGGRVVASTTSDRRGQYRLPIPAGTYLMEVQTGAWPRCPELRIVVNTSSVTRADILCDTGIR